MLEKKNVMRVQRLRENQFERKREGKYIHVGHIF
jgi:hypothetical protein